MKKKNELNTFDALLILYFCLSCPVIIISIITGDDTYPALGYVIFVIAGIRCYQLFFKNKKAKTKSRKRERKYVSGEEIITNIAGVTFENRQGIIQKMYAGQKVYLLREEDNLYDKNAIQVLVEKSTEGNKANVKRGIYGELFEKECIGYINRELAANISAIFDEYTGLPNQFVIGEVLSVTNIESSGEIIAGVKIHFKLPTEKDFQIASNRNLMYPFY